MAIPDWAPNLHPMIVHFPIALLFLAVGFDVLTWFLNGSTVLRRVASGLYAAGAVSGIAAFYSGRAATTVLLPTDANSVLTHHEDWALRMVWFYGLYALARIGFAWRGLDRSRAVLGGLTALGTAGLFLVYETGEHGAEMVYRYGVGVSAAALESGEVHDHEAHPGQAPEHVDGPSRPLEDSVAGNTIDTLPAETFTRTERGWRWTFGEGAAERFSERFGSIGTVVSRVRPTVVNDSTEGPVLALSAGGSPSTTAGRESFGSVQVDARLNLDDFDGRFALLHHVQGGRYGFLELSRDGRVLLGRRSGDVTETMDDATSGVHGWVDVRLVSDGTHFRGYVNGSMVVHGHGPEPDPGAIGLRIDGDGVVQVRSLSVSRLGR